MVGHCAAACHCACSASSTFVPVMYSPAVFSSSTSSSTRSSSRPARPPPSLAAAAPLLAPKPKPKPAVVDAEDSSERGCPGWVCAVGLAGLVVAAVILVFLFI
ncbi:hypothetical protein PVAP13_4KG335300 [Panicum virgatum]|uniref:Uncharacterized protein n=1 Tax=Panicum virgatum TaxID=38727 RepID=A0A8T0TWP9_PANVG|nr:hypothetical protein PVAP13_4KG335300 [Panicum virgatum]